MPADCARTWSGGTRCSFDQFGDGAGLGSARLFVIPSRCRLPPPSRRSPPSPRLQLLVCTKRSGGGSHWLARPSKPFYSLDQPMHCALSPPCARAAQCRTSLLTMLHSKRASCNPPNLASGRHHNTVLVLPSCTQLHHRLRLSLLQPSLIHAWSCQPERYSTQPRFLAVPRAALIDSVRCPFLSATVILLLLLLLFLLRPPPVPSIVNRPPRAPLCRPHSVHSPSHLWPSWQLLTWSFPSSVRLSICASKLTLILLLTSLSPTFVLIPTSTPPVSLFRMPSLTASVPLANR